MTLCENCGSKDMYEVMEDARHVFKKCTDCGKMRLLRRQEPRGSRWVDGVREEGLVECSGEIET